MPSVIWNSLTFVTFKIRQHKLVEFVSLAIIHVTLHCHPWFGTRSTVVTFRSWQETFVAFGRLAQSVSHRYADKLV